MSMTMAHGWPDEVASVFSVLFPLALPYTATAVAIVHVRN